MYGDTANKWLYDIFLGKYKVGNQGELAFDSKESAEIDAKEYIKRWLSAQYKVAENEFVIDCYQAKY